ncbi:MAG: hypothetical protein HY821_00280 [Acidobacteria bacterium]|nr:hypothetical protein [Acidobacteriota bacterium]
MQELGHAINESLSDSDRIAEAIGEIKSAGYDVFLVLEATIGFNKRDESDEEEEGAVLETRLETDFEEVAEAKAEPKKTPRTRRLKWTSQDQKFLKALKISVDEEKNR